MFERVVENWLTKVNERQYQLPFCQLLVSRGYRVLYVSPHGPQEQGKDVVAIDSSGQPTAFQLKTGDIDLGVWRKIYQELVDLVELPIQYPGVAADGRHRCVLVTNGVIRDTVKRAILEANAAWTARSRPRLEVVVKDQLLRDLLDLHGGFFPAEGTEVTELLRLYVDEGTGPLPRERLAGFLKKHLPLWDLPERWSRREPRKRKNESRRPGGIARHLASAAVLAAYAIHPFTRQGNHLALFEAWTMVGAYVLAVSARHRLEEARWSDTFDIAFLAARRAMAELIEEALSREHLLEGDVLVDSAVYRARVTILIGVMAAYDLICRVRGEGNPFREASRAFIESHRHKLYLWGESAVPYFLALGWHGEQNGRALLGEELWAGVLRALVRHNSPADETQTLGRALPDPYLGCEEAMRRATAAEPDDAEELSDYAGQVYTSRALVMLLALRLRRQVLRSLWYDVTGVNFAEFYPKMSAWMLLWRCPKGDLRITLPDRPQSWTELLTEARGLGVSAIPKEVAARPDFLIAFLCVYPHRVRADTVKAIDDALQK